MASAKAAMQLAKTDSEDEDFDPKAVAPSEVDSVAAEAFHEQDAVPEHECSDVERPGFDDDDDNTDDKNKIAEHISEKAAVSTNGIAKEKDGNDDGTKVDNDNNNDIGNGITNDKEEVSAAKDSPVGKEGTTQVEKEKDADATTTKDGAKAEVEPSAENNSNPVEKVETAVAVAKDKAANGESASVKTDKSEAKEVLANDDATKELNVVAKAAVAAVEAKNKVASTKNDEFVDELWKVMNQPVGKSTTPRTKRPTSSNSGLDAWLSAEPSVPAKKATSGLPRLEEATEASAKLSAKLTEEEAAKRQMEAEEGRARKRQKVGTGLESVLAAAKNQDSGPTTMDRTKKDWKEFKKTDEEIEDELEAYKKDKSRYTERVEFLERSNMREWEVEQAGKKGRPPPNSSRNA